MNPVRSRAIPLFLLVPLSFFLHSLSADDFPTPVNSEKSKESLKSPAEVVKGTRLREGFQLSVFASEPDVQNPIAMTTDERGRLWIAENYSWSGGQLGLFNAQQRDRVIILEDTNGDGVHDKRTVFWDDARKLTSIEVGFGGVWLISLPKVLFIPDKNRDDIPDGPAQVFLDGIDEGAVGHTPANGLRLGPDGWIYARHGIQATSAIGRPGASDSQRIRINTGVWRFHPIDGTVETVMHGMTNSWGFDFDQHGEMFVINTVIGHLWHTVPGAHVRRMYGVDLNPHTYQLIEQTADHFHWDTGETWNAIQKGMTNGTDQAGGGHAHIGLLIYQGDNWPEEYRNRLYTLNLHGMRINSNRLEREGAGYVGKRAPDMCFVADTWFRGMEMLTGPDGGVFIADWTDTGECHDHDGVHRTSGRIYKLTYQKPKPIAPFDLTNRSDEELINLLSHNNTWWPRVARRILTERYAAKPGEVRQKVGSQLRTRYSGATSVVHQLRIMESLYGIGEANEGWLIEQLANSDEHIRTSSLRFLVDRLHPDRSPSSKTKSALESLSKNDPSGLVDLYLASALQRLPLNDRWPMARELAMKEKLAQDRMFPFMLWYGIEAAVPHNPEEAIALAGISRIPIVTENISRRLSFDLEQHPDWLDRLLVATESPTFQHQERVLAGIANGLFGWQKASAPKSWPKFVARLAGRNSSEIDGKLKSLQVIFGDGKAIDELRLLVEDGKGEPEARKQALRSLLQKPPTDFGAILVKLLGDRAMSLDAIRGLAKVEHPDAPKLLVQRAGSWGPAERIAMIDTLASRPLYARALLAAIRDKVVAPSEVSAFHARQIHSFENAELTRDLSELWGELRSTSAERKQAIDQLRSELTVANLGKSDHRSGRAVFQKSCASCHVLYGAGRTIGPDLTGSNRKNLEYLLENILDPSASVGKDFRSYIALLEDGRVVNGVVSQMNDRTVTLLTAQEPITLDRNQISQLKQTTTSLMPDGLLQNLTADQIRDLFGYLMGSEQVPLEEPR